MKGLYLILLFTLNTAIAASSCIEPLGKYTSKEMVINQFILKNGSPNWGDWCYEGISSQENKLCNKELDAWDSWLSCSEELFKKSCEKWADKENFTSNAKEYDQFILECIQNNYKDLSNSAKSDALKKTKCEVSSSFSELTRGTNKEVICKEVAKALTGSSTLSTSSQLYIRINSRTTYELKLNQINLKVKNKYLYKGSGTLKWNPDGEEVFLD